MYANVSIFKCVFFKELSCFETRIQDYLINIMRIHASFQTLTHTGTDCGSLT